MNPIDKLVHELAKLPGIGERTAARLAFFILREDNAYAEALSSAILSVKNSVKLCSTCMNLTQVDPCKNCSDRTRDNSMICVVEEPTDVMAVERTHAYRGLYHVLHGAISPLDGIGPDELKIAELLRRLESGSVSELILATNPSVEGEATALYITRLVKPAGLKVSRIASGVPVGSSLEYIDASTLSRALEERRTL